MGLSPLGRPLVTGAVMPYIWLQDSLRVCGHFLVSVDTVRCFPHPCSSEHSRFLSPVVPPSRQVVFRLLAVGVMDEVLAKVILTDDDCKTGRQIFLSIP